MERLTGLDASFLYNETPTLHMHTLKYTVLDVSTVPGGYDFERFQHELERRLHLLPAVPAPHRRGARPAAPPGVDRGPRLRPRATTSAASACHRPAAAGEMDEVIADIASWPLDRSRPLWEIWMLEGPRGRAGRVPRQDPPHGGRRCRRAPRCSPTSWRRRPTTSTRRRRSHRGAPEPVPTTWRLLRRRAPRPLASAAVQAARRCCAAPTDGVRARRAPSQDGGGRDAAADPRHRAARRSTASLTPHRSFATGDPRARRREGGQDARSA